MATNKQSSINKQVKKVLAQSPEVEEVEVTLKYKMPEEANKLKDVNEHKGKGVMYE
jgi:metal-sulfur cluster biosynthetic enzyme